MISDILTRSNYGHRLKKTTGTSQFQYVVIWGWMFPPVGALSSWVLQLKFLPLSNFHPDPGCAGFVPIQKKTCRQKAMPSAKSEAALMDKCGVKGNKLLCFIFSSRSDVFPFPGVGYSEHAHAWSICPQIYIDINGFCTSSLQRIKFHPASPFSLYLSCQLFSSCDSFISLHFLLL